jgi:hypothetical protein
MEKKDNTIRRIIRGALAISLALLAIAVTIPNMGHFVNNPTTHFERSFRDVIFVYAAPVIPLVLIFVGMFGRPNLETIGWGILVILFVGSL